MMPRHTGIPVSSGGEPRRSDCPGAYPTAFGKDGRHTHAIDRAMPALTADIEPARTRKGLAEDWQALQERADHSFFQSWGWVGTWLDWLPGCFEPLCLTVRDGREIVGLGLLQPSRTWRRRLVRSRRLYLSETGDPHYDQLTVECTGFLVDRARQEAVARAAFEGLARDLPEWNELVLPAVGDSTLAQAYGWGWPLRLEKRMMSFYVDLEALQGRSHLASLSANTRQQIKRACRLSNPVTVSVARDLRECREFWARLTDLHQTSWEARGEPGAFANEDFRAFHERLITERFDSGEIQLMRVAGPDGDLGLLYNLVYRGWVSTYQSGLRIVTDNRLKPGLLSHHKAVEWNRLLGHRAYDLMAGDARYKRSLTNAEYQLTRAVVQRDNLAFRLERALGRLRDRFISR